MPKIYGADMSGPLLIEKIQTLQDFTTYDEGRLLYVYDEDSYYIGGINGWIRMTRSSTLVRKQDIDFGTNSNQVNSSCIPVMDLENLFTDPTSITNCLANLQNGLDLAKKSIKSYHIDDKSVYSYHLYTGYDTNAICATTIPCKNTVYDFSNPTTSNIQDTINDLIGNVSYVVRQQVQIGAWQYNSVDENYMCKLSYSPIRKVPPIIQCWDQSNSLFNPLKIICDENLKVVQIYSPYKLFINVVIVG